MEYYAFAGAVPVLPRSNRLKSAIVSEASPFTYRKRPHIVRASSWRASGIPEPESTGSSADDERLSQELQAKVTELFGSRNNITIDMNTDSDVQFIVQRSVASTEARQKRAAWSVIISVAVISVAAGVLFTAMYYAGAVHGSEDSDGRYEMPTYGTQSYIDPYRLLEEDRQIQESKTQ
ncbi:hypothetical protein BWQ96_01200 [Gracilariopsis chorda]|uniref:Uncharacterized protein n=1 Tax=Gracilariopsis chorda TaxID=448386 RepID=A0A2V3J4L8_9FLOR|nr:hypothetical protein BWQ96_01200 [Gracilariopsis chorda]|eukprot:PXF49062.1 hypothetical protein BWQ96_01200 [Gracilariopsis chorda]